MQESTLITTTSRRGLVPVNQKLLSQYDQLIRLVAERLSPDHAFLFAEPSPGEPNATSWYARSIGKPIRLSELPPDQALRLRKTAEALLGEVRDLAARMEADKAGIAEYGKLLRDACIIPDMEKLWSVEGRPVFVDWGMRSGEDSESAKVGAITGEAVRSAGPTPQGPIEGAGRSPGDAAGPAPDRLDGQTSNSSSTAPGADAISQAVGIRSRRPFPWWSLLWLLFAILLLAMAWRLLTACALGHLWPDGVRQYVTNNCPASPALVAGDAAIRAAEKQNQEREIALARKLAACEKDCPPPPPQPPPAPPPLPPQPRTEAPRLIPDLEQRIPPNLRGKLEVTLAWDGPSDLDLYVYCPNNQSINFSNKIACGGKMAEDLNVSGGSSDAKPVEHIAWEVVPTPNGQYSARVKMFAKHSDPRPSIPYTMVLRHEGKILIERQGTISREGVEERVFTFTIPLPGNPR